MTFKRSGSRYQDKSIDPVTLYIAYEGAEDEAKYFSALSIKVPKRFKHLLVVVPVGKSTTAGAPCIVYDDLDQYLLTKNIKLDSSHKALLVIDTDHHFTGTHARKTMQVIKNCKGRHIDILCSNPAFDLWVLCHYIDVSTEDEAFLKKVLRNKNDFVKKQVRSHRRGEDFSSIISRTKLAMTRENNLRVKSTSPSAIPPVDIVSNVGKLFTLIEERGIKLLDSL